MTEKASILWVDDDIYDASSKAQHFSDRYGWHVHFASTATDALKIIRDPTITLSAIILDIMMPPGKHFDIKETYGGYRTGVVLARYIRENFPMIPILAVTAVLDIEVIKWFKEQKYMSILHKPIMIDEIAKELNRLLKKEFQLKIFIVHGHDDKTKLELKNYIQNTLALGEPIILHEQPDLGRTIIEKFEEVGSQVDLVFVLLTPDDIIIDHDKPNSEKRRARQNVIFELGYFYGKLQRRSGRILLLHKGPIEIPTDISGVVYIDIGRGIEAAGEKLRKELSEYLRL